ncbi:hypothetical protein L9G15_23995, partial [Shewanella sp. A3A]|nr:hypothetical protein [Shewanella ferrihydritica]
VSGPRDVLDEMRREQDQAVARYLLHDVSKAHPLERVESRRRLVQDEDTRVVDHGLRDKGASPLAAGEIAQAHTCAILQIDSVQRSVRT